MGSLNAVKPARAQTVNGPGRAEAVGQVPKNEYIAGSSMEEVDGPATFAALKLNDRRPVVHVIAPLNPMAHGRRRRCFEQRRQRQVDPKRVFDGNEESNSGYGL